MYTRILIILFLLVSGSYAGINAASDAGINAASDSDVNTIIMSGDSSLNSSMSAAPTEPTCCATYFDSNKVISDILFLVGLSLPTGNAASWALPEESCTLDTIIEQLLFFEAEADFFKEYRKLFFEPKIKRLYSFVIETYISTIPYTTGSEHRIISQCFRIIKDDFVREYTSVRGPARFALSFLKNFTKLNHEQFKLLVGYFMNPKISNVVCCMFMNEYVLKDLPNVQINVVLFRKILQMEFFKNKIPK